MQSEITPASWLDRPLFRFLPSLKVETVVVVLILLAAIASRFYNLGARVMSHDEVNHVVSSYSLYQGNGYAYDPVTHGPLQFHLIALSYFLLGDSDFSTRVPVVLFSLATIAMALFAYRRYLGRVGALVAGFLFLISPYMLFYARYARNETFIVFWGISIIYVSLRYLETGRNRYLFLFALVTASHFIDKATSFIFSAEILLFLFFVFVERITRRPWVIPAYLRYFVILMLLAVLIGAGAFGLAVISKPAASAAATPVQPGPVSTPIAAAASGSGLAVPLLLGAALLTGAAALFFLIKGVGLKGLRDDRSFDLIILLLTLILPLLAAIPVQLIGGNPLDYSNPSMLRDLGFIVPLFLVSIGIGLWWKPSVYLRCMGMFYLIFVVFYTTFFTNGAGLGAGMMGALGYWMSQQAVQRGSQPWYYYLLVQVPVYEYLPALGAILAAVIGLRHRLWIVWPGRPFERAREASPAADFDPAFAGEMAEVETDQAETAEVGADSQETGAEADELVELPATEVHVLPDFVEEGTRPVPVLPLLLFWSASSLLAFSIAGEKMPWLTTHIALPLILAASWAIGYLVESVDWAKIWAKKGLLVFLLVVVLLASLGGALGVLLGNTPPFLGKELAQLQVTTTFLVSGLIAIAAGVGLVRLLLPWTGAEIRRAFTLGVFALLAVLTIRTSVRAAYVNYDNAMEFLVYAHAARGPKDALEQIAEISYRTTGGKAIDIAYDNDVQYPYWWYLRDYPNKRFFTDSPTRDLRNSPIIAVGAANFSKIEPVVGNDYYKFEYMRLWWPAQDIYFNLTLEKIWQMLSNPDMRTALFQIWFNRDYTLYAKVANNPSLTLETWSPGDRMRLYIRKDVVASIWKYGVAPVAAAPAVDPYAKGKIQLTPDAVVGASGTDPGQFNAPRGLAFAPDGSMYVADSRNNRIEHLTKDGTVIKTWGTFADISKGDAPGGTFYEPWGVAVGKDGSVFVADTWNNRIQKFTADGEFIKMWGYFGQAEKPEAFWGPRGLAVDASGKLFITDTGNKRVVIFDADGNYVAQFGTAGLQAGQFDEPVGIAIDKEGRVYVADTWNQRMQVLSPDPSGTVFTPTASWDINGWTGQSLDNKPFVAVDANQNVFVTDPEGYRVLEFDSQGKFLRTWGDYSAGTDGIGLASGIAIDPQGGVWVSDAGNSRLLRFVPPSP